MSLALEVKVKDLQQRVDRLEAIVAALTKPRDPVQGDSRLTNTLSLPKKPMK